MKKRHTKETYINEKETCKRDLHMWKRDEQKRSTCMEKRHAKESFLG